MSLRAGKKPESGERDKPGLEESWAEVWAVSGTRGLSPRDWHGWDYQKAVVGPKGKRELEGWRGEIGLGRVGVENPSTAFGKQGQVRARMVEQLHVY